jgi:hypothetical protein
MKSFWGGLGALAEYKIQLAILGVLISLASFGTWKWKQEQHEKFLEHALEMNGLPQQFLRVLIALFQDLPTVNPWNQP